jgi:hypothetical protein
MATEATPSPETKPTAEELWERAGYLRAAFDAALDAAEDSDTAFDAALAADAAAAAAANAAYDRGRERWSAEHPPSKP